MTGPTFAPGATDTTYFVYADYGYVTEREIFSSTDWHRAKKVYDEEVMDPCDMACDISMELASFAENGEYIVHDQQAPEEKDWESEVDYSGLDALYAA